METSLLEIVIKALRERGYSEREIEGLREEYATPEGKKKFFESVGFSEEKSEEVVHRFSRDIEKNPYVREIRDFSENISERISKLDDRIYELNTRLSKTEGKIYIVVTVIVVVLSAVLSYVMRLL